MPFRNAQLSPRLPVGFLRRLRASAAGYSILPAISNRHTPKLLEITLTYTKQTPGPVSNRQRYAHFFSRNRICFVRFLAASRRNENRSRSLAMNRFGMTTKCVEARSFAALRMTDKSRSRSLTAIAQTTRAGFGMTTQMQWLVARKGKSTNERQSEKRRGEILR